MKKQKRLYNPGHILSSIVMLLALSWLTVSAPFVYKAQQQMEQVAKQYAAPEGAEEEGYNPFASANEEKTGSGSNTLSEEYLHHAHHIDHHSVLVVKTYNTLPDDEYLAYHPEAFSPPPEA